MAGACLPAAARAPQAIFLQRTGVGQPKAPSMRPRGPTSQAVWYCSIAPSHHRWYDAFGVTLAWILARREAPTRLL